MIGFISQLKEQGIETFCSTFFRAYLTVLLPCYANADRANFHRLNGPSETYNSSLDNVQSLALFAFASVASGPEQKIKN